MTDAAGYSLTRQGAGRGARASVALGVASAVLGAGFVRASQVWGL